MADATYTFRDAYIDSIAWGAMSASIYLILWCLATFNLSGTSALIKPMGWAVSILVLPFLIALVSLFTFGRTIQRKEYKIPLKFTSYPHVTSHLFLYPIDLY